MIDMRRARVVLVVVIALVSSACASASAPSGSTGLSTPTYPASTRSATTGASPAPATTAEPSPAAAFRALDTPASFTTSSAEAVDGTTAVGWVEVGTVDEKPAIWDTTTGMLRVLDVPTKFVHPSGNTFVRLVGVSGTTAVGTGILGTEKRGKARAITWNTETGDLTILDIPAGFTQTEAHAISATTAIGQAWTADGEAALPVAWDTQTGAVRALEMPAGFDCGDAVAVSGATIVGTRCEGDAARPVIWSPLTAEARDLDLLPGRQDGIPHGMDGMTAVGECCFGEEGTPLPLLWDTSTGAVQQLELPVEFPNGTAESVSGTVAVGAAASTPLLWDLETGQPSTLPAPAGYESVVLRAVSGLTIVGFACQPPASAAVNPRCVAAAWTLP